MPERTTLSADAATHDGAAIYSPTTLSLYDLVVLGISNQWIWQCPSPIIAAWYAANISEKHLDIGVGTGYFLDRAVPERLAPEITLLDLNPSSLGTTRARIGRYGPDAVRANVLDTLPFESASFGSIGMNYLLHCIPGTWAEKGRLFEEARRVLRPGGTLFGSTILCDQCADFLPARALMGFYNSKGVFHNTADTLDALRRALYLAFPDARLRVQGQVALFAATRRR